MHFILVHEILELLPGNRLQAVKQLDDVFGRTILSHCSSRDTYHWLSGQGFGAVPAERARWVVSEVATALPIKTG